MNIRANSTISITFKKQTWEIITLAIKDSLVLAGEQVVPTCVQVQNKWKALVNTYKKYTDEANKSGSGRKNVPAYYEELSEIYG